MTADEIIERLGLEQHPEGGWFREIYRDVPEDGGRGKVTSIFFLLRAGERSHWHRVDATEVWHFHGGAPLLLSISEDGRVVREETLGLELAAGALPQRIVPAGAWQAARSLGEWTLIGCTVAPAFEFAGFELAAPDWAPG